MAKAHRLCRVVVGVLATAGALACEPRPAEVQKAGPPPASAQAGAAGAPAAIDPAAPSIRELQNATFRGVEEAEGAFTLTDGRWVGKPYAPGGASAPGVTLVRDVRLAGDLDGDGGEEAVVLLAGSTGGTGETAYLAAVRRTAGQVENFATAPVGDRVQLRAGRIDGRRIVLDLVQAGDKDAGCCPGDLVTRTWDLQGGKLVEGPAVTTGRLSLETLAGDEWVLRALAWDEAAPATPEITLKLDGKRLTGNAGCNTYSAPVKAGPQPGDLAVGPAATTRRMCPQPEMALEQRFTQQLSGVRQMRFAGGQLALPYNKPDGSFGVMLFERRTGS